MKKINTSTLYIAIGALALGIFVGWIGFGGASSQEQTHDHGEEMESSIWTCSMHPQIRQEEPGQCPLCGMDLIPLNNKSSSDDNPMEIKMSPTAMQLANVQTSIIMNQVPVKETKLNGKVKADERRISSQTSHISGRIEGLYVNYTGESINPQQELASIYSPDLVTAQEELFQAYKIKESQPALYQAARKKLSNWKLTEKQIDNIVRSGKPQERFPILADVSGVLINKRVNLGDYIQKGQSLFEVADLSRVWVLFDVYESDMGWIKKGDTVSYTMPSLPGETFEGKITFIDPFVNPKTRVASARIELQNPGLILKPDMFVVGIVKSPIGNMTDQLIVPKSAIMWTGERSVVYVKQASVAGVSFIMREVTLGASLGDSYLIEEGIEEGEEIATNGTFSIDAAAQLAGKPSMMNPEGGAAMTGHNHGGTPSDGSSVVQTRTIAIGTKAKEVLMPLFDEYLLMKDALAADDFDKSRHLAAGLYEKLNKSDMSVFTGEAHDVWMEHSITMEKALKPIRHTEKIDDVRAYFKLLSDQMVMLANTFGPMDKTLYIEHCPMADGNKGADWISAEKAIQNPYFGESMLRCGKVLKEIK